jgi:hypothetical protein
MHRILHTRCFHLPVSHLATKPQGSLSSQSASSFSCIPSHVLPSFRMISFLNCCCHLDFCIILSVSYSKHSLVFYSHSFLKHAHKILSCYLPVVGCDDMSGTHSPTFWWNTQPFTFKVKASVRAWLLGLLFNPEDGKIVSLQGTGKLLPDYIALQPSWWQFSVIAWGSQISYILQGVYFTFFYFLFTLFCFFVLHLKYFILATVSQQTYDFSVPCSCSILWHVATFKYFFFV